MSISEIGFYWRLFVATLWTEIPCRVLYSIRANEPCEQTSLEQMVRYELLFVLLVFTEGRIYRELKPTEALSKTAKSQNAEKLAAGRYIAKFLELSCEKLGR